MIRRRSTVLKPLLLCALILFAQSPACSGFTGWMNHNSQPGLFLELAFPRIEDPSGVSSDGIIIFLTGTVSLGETVRLNLQAPYINQSKTYIFSSGGGFSISQSAFANPYIGVEVGRDGTGVLVNFGIRPPAIEDDKAWPVIIGALSCTGRFEAFLPDNFSIRGSCSYRYVSQGKLILKITAGSTVLLPTESNGTATESLFDLEYDAWGRFGNLIAGGSVSHRVLVSKSNLDFSHRLTSQMLLAAQLQFGHIQPGMSLVLPLDDQALGVVNNPVKVVLGMSAVYFFERPKYNDKW